MRLNPWYVVLFSLVLTYWLWKTTYSNNAEISRTRFHNRVTLVTELIQEAVGDGEKALRGCAGLYASTPRLTRAIWHNYVTPLEMARTFPGVQGIGFAPRVHSTGLASFVQGIRAEGSPRFSVEPAGPREEYFPVTYIEPVQDRNLRALGYDMFSEPVRRAAMEFARDTRQAAISGMVTLMQEIPGTGVQAGFLMYYPVYSSGPASTSLDEWRKTLLGFVYLAVRFGDFLDHIVFSRDLWLGISVYDGEEGDPRRLAYASINASQSEKVPASHVPMFAETVNLPVYGRVWTVKFISLPAFDASANNSKAWLVLVLGLCSSLFLGVAIHLMERHRVLQATEALNLALARSNDECEEKLLAQTADLKRTNRLLRLLSDWDKTLIRAESETQLLEEMADLAVGVGGFRTCLVGFLTKETEPDLRPVVLRGDPVGCLQTLTPPLTDVEATHCPLRSAVRTGNPVVASDLMHQPDCPKRCISPAPDIPFQVALPLISAGTTLGVISFFSSQPGAFDANEITILKEMAADLAFGITTLRSRAARLRAEEDLLASEMNLKEAQALAHIGNWTMNVATGKTSFSEEMFRIAGLDPSLPAPTAQEVAALFGPDGWQRARTAVDQAIAAGKPSELDLELHRPDGTTRWIHATEHVRRDALGQVVEWYGTNQDITQQKMMQDELRKSEEKYRRLMDQLPAGVVVYGANARAVYCNPQAAAFLGMTAEQFVGRSVEANVGSLLREDSTPMAVSEHPALIVLATGRPIKDLVLGISSPTKDKARWMTVSAFPEFDDQKQVQRVVVMTVDITTLKEAEEALRNSEEKYRTFFDASPDGILIFDLETKGLKFANPTICHMLGYSETELQTMDVLSLHPKETGPRVLAVFQAQERGESILAADCPLLRKDGTIFFADVNANMISIGRKKNMIGFFRDTTERRRSMEKIQAQLEELQRWNDLMLGREERIQELKSEINELCRRLDEAVRYPSQETNLEDTRRTEAIP